MACSVLSSDSATHDFVSDMPTSYSTGIVGTAIMYCGALTTIDVSGNFIHDRTTDSSIAEALQPALKKHQQGGLEVFNAAFVAETDRYARSTAYINSLCDSCPKIQVLNGWNSVSDILQADEQWIIDEITWERFCRICTDLRSFNWQVVPFSTNFLKRRRRPLRSSTDRASSVPVWFSLRVRACGYCKLTSAINWTITEGSAD